jgi:3-deoxy-D-manno-octulosonic-acid transferase/heptosyltransferase-1
MNILIVKLSALGDVVHTLPALNVLRRAYPHAHITWLVEAAAADIIRDHPALDTTIVSRRKKWIRDIHEGEWLRTIKDIGAFVRTLRNTRYDMVIDFQGLFKSGMLVALCKGNRKIGYDQTREESYRFLTERIPPFDLDQHAILRYLNLLKASGIANNNDITFRIPVKNNKRQRAYLLLKQNQWHEGNRFIAINPMAKWNTKLWIPQKFAVLADQIIQEHNISVVFTGSQEDQKAIQEITSLMQEKGIDLSGKTDLLTLAALYEKAEALISTDTGPMHVAAAMGTPVIALFGPTAPWRTGPFGSGHTIIQKGIPCSPCFKKKCAHLDCMNEIEVAEVLSAVSKVINYNDR